MKDNQDNKLIFGVCAALAEKTGIPLPLVRVGFVLGAVFSFGLAVLVYILLAIFMK